jgi:DNA-binding winged helix-turn-helix (wHTH) protein/predicted ATPase
MRYRFSDCVFDASREELYRQGEVMHTTPQALKVLRYLLEHRERVVSRDELLEQCWPDSYVSDATLTSCLRRVRQSLGQRGSGSSLIQTVHRRGYRFVAEVIEADDAVPGDVSVPLSIDVPAEPLTRPLSDTSPPPEAPLAVPVSPPDAAATAERRLLSVLSCTLAEGEHLARQLEAEDHYELIQRFRTTCVEIMAPYGGHVVQQSDAGLVVYFGYPQAYEDAALRAVRSALALTQAMRDGALGTWAGLDTTLAVQVGIATDMMIVRSGDDPEGASPPLGVGRASSLALRLGTVAAPGTVVISEATARLVRGYVTCKVLEDVRLAGGDTPLAYEVRGASALQSRLEVESLYGLTPFVGREIEVALLAERWASVQEGMGQVVLVRGEAGMGKSRLVQVWHEQVGDALPLAWSCRCSPYHQHTALYPLVELLRRALDEASSSPAAQLESLEAVLDQHGFDLAETVPLLAALVSLPLPASRYTPLNLTPQRQRERTLETLVSLFAAQAAASPVLFVVEDLHWADPSTLDFLERLMQQAATVSLMLVLTCRPEFALPWEPQTTLTPVALHRLTQAQTVQMIRQVAAGKRVPDEVVQQIVDKTDGVPLFVEELTRMVLESGELVEGESAYTLRDDLTQLTIPATLHGSLLARLDRLGMAKDLAQWGSIVGREFSYAVLAAVVPSEAEALQQALTQLVKSELVYPRGVVPHTRYRFKHALVRDAAYDALPRRRRRGMHRQLAEMFEAHFPQLVEAEPEVLAHHYTAAQCPEQAIPYWQRAGQQALQRSAHAEAIGHVRQGLTLLTTLPETPARRRQELDLQVALGPALIAIKGNAAPEVERAYARARELCQQVDDAPQVFLVLRGLMMYYQTLGHMQTTTRLGEQLFRLAEAQPDPAPRMLAHYQLGMALFLRGELVSAQTHHTQALALYTPQAYRALAVYYGVDFGVASGDFLAWELWSLGFPDQALQHSQAARALAQEVSHPSSLGHALLYPAIVHQCRHEAPAAQEQAGAATTLATEQGFAYYLARAMVVHGWALAMQGEREPGIAEIRQGLARLLALGDKVFHPYFLGLLAEAYGANGCPEAGLEALTEAMTVMDTTEMRFYAAELSRLKGVLLLQQEAPDASQAETCFHQALDIARQQEAKSWELRAATSLARLWQSQGKRQEAHDLLAPVYGWFTEGFDTADLKEAKGLLDELS